MRVPTRTRVTTPRVHNPGAIPDCRSLSFVSAAYTRTVDAERNRVRVHVHVHVHARVCSLQTHETKNVGAAKTEPRTRARACTKAAARTRVRVRVRPCARAACSGTGPGQGSAGIRGAVLVPDWARGFGCHQSRHQYRVGVCASHSSAVGHHRTGVQHHGAPGQGAAFRNQTHARRRQGAPGASPPNCGAGCRPGGAGPQFTRGGKGHGAQACS